MSHILEYALRTKSRYGSGKVRASRCGGMSKELSYLEVGTTLAYLDRDELTGLIDALVAIRNDMPETPCPTCGQARPSSA